MRFCTQQHRFYAGIDLYARSIALCVLDDQGQIALEANQSADPAALLDALAPFRDGLCVAAACRRCSGVVSSTGSRVSVIVVPSAVQAGSADGQLHSAVSILVPKEAKALVVGGENS